MESYIILCKKEEYLYRYLLEAYLRDGYRIAASYQDLTALSSKEAIEKEEFTDDTFDLSFHQKTNMHIPYLYYLLFSEGCIRVICISMNRWISAG